VTDLLEPFLWLTTMVK